MTSFRPQNSLSYHYLSTLMQHIGQAKSNQELQNFERNTATLMFFSIDLNCNDNWLCQKNINFLNIVLKTINWMKPAQPSDSLLLTATILMGPCNGNGINVNASLWVDVVFPWCVCAKTK